MEIIVTDLKRRVIKYTTYTIIVVTSVCILTALVAVLMAHASPQETLIALTGSLGIGIALGALSFPIFWFVFSQLGSKKNNNKKFE